VLYYPEPWEVTMAKDPMSSFEIPADMRRLAETSVAQAKQAFDGFMTAAQQAVSALEGQAAVAQASAKDVQEVMQLQAEFARAQMEALGAQAKELGESATKAAMDTAKPKT